MPFSAVLLPSAPSVSRKGAASFVGSNLMKATVIFNCEGAYWTEELRAAYPGVVSGAMWNQPALGERGVDCGRASGGGIWMRCKAAHSAAVQDAGEASEAQGGRNQM